MPGLGGARPGAGRPAGSPNRRSNEFRDALNAALEGMDFDLIRSVVDIARAGEDETTRLAACKVLLDYAYPKLKAIEATVVEPVRVRLLDPTMPPDGPDPLA